METENERILMLATLEANFVYGPNIIELIWYTRLTFSELFVGFKHGI